MDQDVFVFMTPADDNQVIMSLLVCTVQTLPPPLCHKRELLESRSLLAIYI